jgi:NADH-quinone oxidoreductase subunit J
MADLLFYVLGGVTLGTAALTVLSRNAVNSAMFFLLSLLATAGLFVLLDAYLLAVLLVLVYAGAVVALFLFIIMLLDMQRATSAAAVAATGLLTVGVLSFVKRAQLSAAPVSSDLPVVGASLKSYAAQLFTTYLLPVQVVGFLLLIAMLGVIVLSKRFEGLEDIK